MPEYLFKSLLFGGIGALAALLANRALSAYHDGLRPLMPEYRRGELSHEVMGRRAYDMSIGFVLFYALPFSLVNGVMVSHTIFLAADVIGVRLARPFLAVLAGAMYGFGASLLVSGVFHLLVHLPVNFVPDLQYLVEPLGYLLGLMPVLAIAQQYGLRHALTGFALVLGARFVAAGLHLGWNGLTADGIALLVGLVYLLALALRRRGAPIPGEAQLFAANISNLRQGLPYLLGIGGLVALVAHFGWLGGEPAAALLVGDGRMGDAAAVAFFSAVGFLPLVVSTSAVTGAYSTQGYPDWVPAIGYVAPLPMVAVVLGFGVMLLEVLGLERWLALLGRFPDLRMLGPVVRDAMTTVTEIAMLVGGLVAAAAIWPGYGMLVVGTCYVLNEQANRPVMRLAAGPVGAIGVGLAANVAKILGAY